MRVIIPSVRYSDLLAVTLPAWRALLPTSCIVVACASWNESDGVETGLDWIPTAFWRTDAWQKDGAIFNKAAALQEMVSLAAPGDICIVADADVVPFGRLPPEAEIEPDTLYGCARYQCDTPEQLEAYRAGSLTLDAFPLMQPRSRHPVPAVNALWAANACVGYFQMFRYSPGRSFGSYPTAGGYDAAFRRQFPRRVGLTDFHVLHLGESTRENWKGRVVPPWPAAVSA